MRSLKMLPGAAPSIAHPVWIDRIVTVSSEESGIFYPLVQRGTYSEAGMKIGYVTNYFGKTVYEAYAKEAGVIRYICSVPSMKRDDTVAYIGVLASKHP